MPDSTPPASEIAPPPETGLPATREAPSTPDLLTAAASDRCANCDAPLATDQRYCVNCGERRGRSRFSLQSSNGAAPPPPPPARKRQSRMPAGATLIAGVATLLLAMGVGVLIGQNGSSNNGKLASASAPQVITVNGGGGSTGGGSTTTASTTSHKSGRSGGKSKSNSNSNSKGPVAHLTKKTTTAVNNGVKNVVGGTKLAPATVKVGGKCSNGEAGCQGGKFTGGFFGGG